MRPNRAALLTIVLIVLSFFLMLPSFAFAFVDGEVVVSGKCTACHSDERIKSQSLTSGEWTILVDQEIDRGAQLNGEERSAVIDYLVANYSMGANATPVAQVTSSGDSSTPSEQAETGIEMWQFIVAGSSFIGTGIYLRRKK